MIVVADVSELNWWVRRFASRITLRLSLEAVGATSTEGAVHAAPVLTVIRKGDRTLVAGIGDDPVTNADAIRIPAFSSSVNLLDPSDAIERFLRVLLKRLKPSGGLFRPVVIVHGLHSLEGVLGGRQCELVTRALSA
jgi:hypothetical protein